MKIVFILLFALCIIAAAHLYSKKYERQIALCESFLSFLQYAETQVRFSSKTVLEICESFCALHGNSLVFLCECTEPVSESVHQKIALEKALSERQKSMICEFFSQFGLADEQASLNQIENCKQVFAQQFSREKEECFKKIKLIHRLSVLLAAALAILLI